MMALRSTLKNLALFRLSLGTNSALPRVPIRLRDSEYQSVSYHPWKYTELVIVHRRFNWVVIETINPHIGIRGAFHSQKISYTFGKNPFVFKKNPSKICINPFVLKKSRTLFPMSEVPLVGIHANDACYK